MGMRLTKPWVALTAEAIAALPAQLGVYQLATGDGDSEVVKIGYAGATEPFGMRSALEAELANHAAPLSFRHEFTHGYMTRWQELLMIHQADYGAVPLANEGDAYRIGRLSVAPESTAKGAH